MEMIFRKLEYWIEGDYMQQKALDKADWNTEKIIKKSAKHTLFFGISFLIANTFLAYLISLDTLWTIITEPPTKNLTGFLSIVAFTFAFYFVFAKLREQACTIVCPYGRLQAALIDKHSLIVSYDHKRGEPRQKIHKGENRNEAKLGDCIDCKQCVLVCPMGIDIRNGLQMECTHCTACIDACDDIMTKIEQPKGLIRYASLNGIEKSEPFKITPRMVAYTAVLGILLSTIALILTLRSSVDATLLRARGTTFQTTETTVSNLYNFKVANKTSDLQILTLKVLEPQNAKLNVIGGETELRLEPEKLAESTLFIEIPKGTFKKVNSNIKIGIYNQEGKLLQTVQSKFMSPIQ